METKTETWEERIAREQGEKRARCLAFAGKIEKAFELAGLEVFGIKSDEEYADRRQATLKGTSRSAYISASIDRYGYKGRVCIALWYTGQLSHRDVWGYNSAHVEITVSETKTAEQIAADIKRRILPTLAESIKKADEVIRKRDEYAEKTKRNVKLLGGDPTERHGGIDRTVRFDGGSAEVSGDSVSLSLYSVRPETAKAIIDVIKRMEQGR